MNRLHTELHRLFLLSPHEGSPDAAGVLIDAAGHTRCLVLELGRPGEWSVLGEVWQRLQSELEWPAPAIAVSGRDGLQLWLSLREAVSSERAAEVLTLLRLVYLGGVPEARLRAWPAADAPHTHAALVPAEQPDTGNWSAFVAPDLAPVFAESPWLDIPPSTDGQADLLARVRSIPPAALDAAQQRLQQLVPRHGLAVAAAAPLPPAMAHPPAALAAPGEGPGWGGALREGDVNPHRFLQQVLNDPAVPLALRIEAAKALLPWATAGGPPRG